MKIVRESIHPSNIIYCPECGATSNHHPGSHSNIQSRGYNRYGDRNYLCLKCGNKFQQ